MRDTWHSPPALPTPPCSYCCPSPPALGFSPCPSPPAPGCSVAAGPARHLRARGLGRSLHRTAAASWWPRSCLPHSPQRSSQPGPDAPYAVLGTQCRPRQTWGRGSSGSLGRGAKQSPTGVLLPHLGGVLLWVGVEYTLEDGDWGSLAGVGHGRSVIAENGHHCQWED